MLLQKVFQKNSMYSALIKKANYAIDLEMEGVLEDDIRRASDCSKEVLWARKVW